MGWWESIYTESFQHKPFLEHYHCLAHPFKEGKKEQYEHPPTTPGSRTHRQSNPPSGPTEALLGPGFPRRRRGHPFPCCQGSPASPGPPPVICLLSSTAAQPRPSSALGPGSTQTLSHQLSSHGHNAPRSGTEEMLHHKSGLRSQLHWGAKWRRSKQSHPRFCDHSSRKKRGLAPTSSNVSFYPCNNALLIGRACRVSAWLKINPSTAPKRLWLFLRGWRQKHSFFSESIWNLIDPKLLFKWHWLVLTGAGVGIT